MALEAMQPRTTTSECEFSFVFWTSAFHLSPIPHDITENSSHRTPLFGILGSSRGLSMAMGSSEFFSPALQQELLLLSATICLSYIHITDQEDIHFVAVRNCGYLLIRSSFLAYYINHSSSMPTISCSIWLASDSPSNKFDINFDKPTSFFCLTAISNSCDFFAAVSSTAFGMCARRATFRP